MPVQFPSASNQVTIALDQQIAPWRKGLLKPTVPISYLSGPSEGGHHAVSSHTEVSSLVIFHTEDYVG